MAKPTPTQEENDRAALGEHFIVKSPDGSGLETPPDLPDVPDRPEVDPTKKQKQMEPRPAAAGGYQTRHVTPAQPTHPPPLKHEHE